MAVIHVNTPESQGGGAELGTILSTPEYLALTAEQLRAAIESHEMMVIHDGAGLELIDLSGADVCPDCGREHHLEPRYVFTNEDGSEAEPPRPNLIDLAG